MTNISDISYIGVDIAKKTFDICLHDGNYSSCVYQSYSNDLDGFYELFSFLESVNHLENIRLGLEATSTYMIQLQKYLDTHKMRYILINPRQIHHFIKYKNYESKTDKLDSYYISDYIRTLDDKAFKSSFSKTKTLYKSYSAYLNLITKTETHIKGLSDSIMSDDFISPLLKDEIFRLNESLRKTQNKVLKEFIVTIKIAMPEYDHIKNDLVGVNDKTLLAVLPVIYDVSEKYTVKQLQSFVGLNPVHKDSGTSVHGMQRISKAGNTVARSALYMASLSAVQHNDLLKEKYQRLVENGKPRKKALTAISAHIFRAIVTKLNYYKNLNK